ncbi:MAG: STM3941 family protein [Alphaproteobacteria bacterium]
MSTATNRSIVFYRSSFHPVRDVLVSVALMVISAIGLVKAGWDSTQIAVFVLIVIPSFWFGAVFLWGRFLARGKPVVTLSPKGLRDLRIAPEFVPWSAIQHLSIWGGGRSGRAMIVTVPPEVQERLGMSRFARWAHRMNAKLGVKGLCVGEQRLKTDIETLFAATDAYWKIYRDER